MRSCSFILFGDFLKLLASSYFINSADAYIHRRNVITINEQRRGRFLVVLLFIVCLHGFLHTHVVILL